MPFTFPFFPYPQNGTSKEGKRPNTNNMKIKPAETPHMMLRQV